MGKLFVECECEPHFPCRVCLGEGQRRPDPADLLTDPRVQALVEALDAVTGDLYDHAPERRYDAAKAALVPFEVPRG